MSEEQAKLRQRRRPVFKQYLIASIAATHAADPQLGRKDPRVTPPPLPNGKEPMFALGSVNSLLHTSTEIPDLNALQGLFLTACGTLIQFNAIMAAINGGAVTTSSGALKTVSAVALVLHVIAAFMLCWAARPIPGARALNAKIAQTNRLLSANDTYYGYRRGWMLTLVAMLASIGVLSLFLYESFRL